MIKEVRTETKSATYARFDDKRIIYRKEQEILVTNGAPCNINNLIPFIHHAYIKHSRLIKVFFPYGSSESFSTLSFKILFHISDGVVPSEVIMNVKDGGDHRWAWLCKSIQVENVNFEFDRKWKYFLFVVTNVTVSDHIWKISENQKNYFWGQKKMGGTGDGWINWNGTVVIWCIGRLT